MVVDGDRERSYYRGVHECQGIAGTTETLVIESEGGMNSTAFKIPRLPDWENPPRHAALTVSFSGSGRPTCDPFVTPHARRSLGKGANTLHELEVCDIASVTCSPALGDFR